MVARIVNLLNFLENLVIWIVLIDVILGYILSPYHPIRTALDRIVDPMLAPIRRIVPPVGGFDLSPAILIILVIILFYGLRAILYTL